MADNGRLSDADPVCHELRAYGLASLLGNELQDSFHDLLLP